MYDLVMITGITCRPQRLLELIPEYGTVNNHQNNNEQLKSIIVKLLLLLNTLDNLHVI